MEEPIQELELAPRVSFPELIAWNFVRTTAKGPDERYRCLNCGATDIKKSGTNGNLIKHCSNTTCFGFRYVGSTDPRAHIELQPMYRAYWASRKQDGSTVDDFFRRMSPKAKQMETWIDLVTKCNMATSVCENTIMRKHIKKKGVSRKTLRKYLIKLADIVGLVISDQIGPGNCIADGWSCAGIHYFAIYHQWPVLADDGTTIEVKRALLSCAPFIDETSLDAKNQAESIHSTYTLYGSPHQLIVCLTLDNTNTNPATARILKKPMIGAYCHRLNLASRYWLSEAFGGTLMNHLQVINAVMLRVSTLKGRGKLKEFTAYVPSIQNKTRWTGYQDMAAKYDKIHNALEETGLYDELDDDDDDEGEVVEVQHEGVMKTIKIRPRLLTGENLTTFKNNMIPALDKLRMFFKVIQTDLDLSAARECFHSAKNHPLLKGHSQQYEQRLLPSHKLVVSPCFESGVCKIIEGNNEDLTQEEKVACECLLKANWKNLYKRLPKEDRFGDKEEDRHGQYSPSKFFKDQSKKRRISGNIVSSRYLQNLSWISPTTVIVERLFSKNRHIMSFARRRMLPRLFEAIIFLKENQHLWDASLIQDMMAGLWDNRLKEEYDEDQLHDDEVDQLESEMMTMT